MQIRAAAAADAEAIRAIYNAEVTGGTNTFDVVPRTADEQLAWLDRHRGAHPAVVAVLSGPPGRPNPGSSGAWGSIPTPAVLSGPPGRPELTPAVVGFGALSPFRERHGYATTVEDSVYVDGAHRGHGVGRLLLEELVRLAGRHGFHAVIARIVGRNEASIALHRACGFDLVGTEREVGRKHGRWLDVAEMERLL